MIGRLLWPKSAWSRGLDPPLVEKAGGGPNAAAHGRK
jgi:hypothetical protein